MLTQDNDQPTSKFYNSQGLKLHYLDWGNNDAPLLLFVHGMSDHARSWDQVVSAVRQDWHVVCVDLRGHGDSEWSPDNAYHNPYLLADLVALIDHLSNEDSDVPVTIVAHSLGGNPAARFAALYPDRVQRLVLIDAMGPTAPVLKRWEEQGVVSRTREWLQRRQELSSKSPRRFVAVEEAAARLTKVNRHLSEDTARHLALHGLRHHPNGYGWKYDPHVSNFMPEDFAIDLAEYWREITAPTLICWGDESWTTNPATDGRAAEFRDYKTLTFEGAGHWLHHDQLNRFVEELKHFLVQK